ncbi:MAG TPA: glycosyltransferase [Anaeromyxobacteraceae bacterium]|nr:glycosyltransferase [Anaeromyxobacteraceae bacterium]
MSSPTEPTGGGPPPTERPLRIAMVIDAWDEANNGAVVSTRRFTEIFRGQGHEVEVLATGEAAPGKVPLKTFFIPTPGRIMEKMRLPFAWPDRRILQEVIARQDVVHVQFPFYLGIRTITLARQARVPVVSTFHVQAEHLLHNVNVRSRTLVHWVYRFFLRTTYNRSDHVVCPSAFAEKEIRRYGLRVPSSVISNGVPPEYRPPTGEGSVRFGGKFTILSVGRLAREKRHDLLIEAVRRSRHEKDIQLVILGDGPLRARLEEQGKALTNPAIFRWLKPAELIPYYGGADLCVHAAEVEVECMSVLEAMACGLPCLIARSPLSATPQFALNDDFLFEAGSREDLTRRIDSWIENPAALARARDDYREASRRYAVETSAERLLEVYRGVVAANGARRAAAS